MNARRIFWSGLLAGWIVCSGAACRGPDSGSFQPPPVSTESADPAEIGTGEPILPADVTETLRRALAQPPTAWPGTDWKVLWDCRSWKGWLVIPYAGRGAVELRDGVLVMGMGSPFTGVRHTNEFPRMNYEIALEAARLSGSDFFCGLTVPVGNSHCSLIVGGWGGGLVGISSLDGYDASENETTTFRRFEKGRWYRIRMRVTANRLEAWIDDEQVVNVNTEGRRISVRPGDIEECIPLGIACWQTAAGIRNVQWRTVTGPASPPPRSF
ncbi:DUF1080 domain-containing protein [Limisphaera ngatamarikiensis]|uniref:DUF1080 domain-containing protein n=1 Tax=Limisphaera ngatamarikiensis TaxID=1324935 RepID=A0A6M1RSF1_9BACT|nr:family 16 glycoside hydrolase [Limisphaera ngatamarikiensis]NGO40317.1 DUF1080 domain-containing protein [Limisphaera ngatamarikiensis]